MVRVKISGIISLGTRKFCDKVKMVVDNLQGNPNWPTPSPDLLSVTTANNALSLLETESQNGDRTVIAEKRAARAIVVQLFLDLCMYIAFTVRNQANAVELINGLGLEVAKQGGHVVGTLPIPFDTRSQVSQEPGAVDLEWEVETQRGIHSFIIEICDGANPVTGSWRQVASSSTMKYTVKGLVRGTYYSFRVRCLGAKSLISEPGEVTTCLAA